MALKQAASRATCSASETASARAAAAAVTVTAALQPAMDTDRAAEPCC
jgi:hypothetical protein